MGDLQPSFPIIYQFTTCIALSVATLALISCQVTAATSCSDDLFLSLCQTAFAVCSADHLNPTTALIAASAMATTATAPSARLLTQTSRRARARPASLKVRSQARRVEQSAPVGFGRREALTAATGAALLLGGSGPALAKDDKNVGAYLPVYEEDSDLVLFVPGPRETPAIRSVTNALASTPLRDCEEGGLVRQRSQLVGVSHVLIALDCLSGSPGQIPQNIIGAHNKAQNM